MSGYWSSPLPAVFPALFGVPVEVCAKAEVPKHRLRQTAATFNGLRLSRFLILLLQSRVRPPPIDEGKGRLVTQTVLTTLCAKRDAIPSHWAQYLRKWLIQRLRRTVV